MPGEGLGSERVRKDLKFVPQADPQQGESLQQLKQKQNKAGNP